MSTGKWATLDEPTTRAFFQALPQIATRDLRAIMTDAGLQYRLDGPYVRVRAKSAGPFVYKRSITTADRKLRGDADQTLSREALRQSLDVGQFLAQLRQQNRLDVSPSNELQYRLLTDTHTNPARILIEHTRQQCSIIRIGAHNLLAGRTLIWRILDALADGVSASELPIGVRRDPGRNVSGIWEFAPATLVSFPLLARYQPLGMLVVTDRGAQVLVLAPEADDGYVGNYYRSDQMFTGWPVGITHGSLFGRGEGIYKTGVKRFHKSDIEDLLQGSVRGANALMSWLTDPAEWTDGSGALDSTERWITWASVNQAIEAIMLVARDWGSPSSLWNCLRALGTLQGLWEGAQPGRVPLRELFSPQRLRDHVLPTVPNESYRQWTAAVIDNWAHQVEVIGGGDLNNGLRNIHELRHLVHGVGGQGANRDRQSRLQALQLVDRHAPALQLMLDVAVLWWAAAVWDHTTILRPRRSPWEP